MFNYTNTKIAEYAGALGERYLTKKGVDLYAIMKDKDISTSYGAYGSSFEGLLEYQDGEFHIYLNKNLLNGPNTPRARFTIAHELGHFSIPGHKSELLKGHSLSFQGQTPLIGKSPTEREADYFASCLLMPYNSYIHIVRKNRLGIESIYKAKKAFNASLEASTVRYMDINVSATLLIRLDANQKIRYVGFTRQFTQKTGISQLPTLRADSSKIKEILLSVNRSNGTHYESVTSLSSWISTITPGSSEDLLAIEQISTLGKYGAIVLLTVEL